MKPASTTTPIRAARRAAGQRGVPGALAGEVDRAQQRASGCRRSRAKPRARTARSAKHERDLAAEQPRAARATQERRRLEPVPETPTAIGRRAIRRGPLSRYARRPRPRPARPRRSPRRRRPAGAASQGRPRRHPVARRRTMPRPPLKVARSSASSRPPSAPIRRMTAGIRPRPTSTRDGEAVGHGRAAGCPAGRRPVMWAAPRRSWPAARSVGPHLEDGPGVDARGRQQHVGDRRHRLPGSRPGRRRPPAHRACDAGAPGRDPGGRSPTGSRGRAPASSRWRAARTRPGRPRRPRPGPRCRRGGRPLHDADAEPGQVELVGLHQPGVLGRLAADERAADGRAGVGHRRPRSAATRSGTRRPTAR